MYLGGLFYVLSGVVLQSIPLCGETCTFESSVTKTCSEGCCETDCCSESFWNWYVIIGIVVGAIFVLIFLMGLIILLCTYCMKSKQSSGRDLSNTNRIHPSSNRLHPPPYRDPYGQSMPPPPPPYYEFEAPPKYEEIQMTPQVRSSVVPRPKRSSGVPAHTRSGNPRRNATQTLTPT